MPLLQCWLDKSLSAGPLPLKRWSRASLLVNDLTHFLPLQSFHESLLWGCRCYSASPFPPSLAPLPPPPFIQFCAHIASRWRKRCLYRRYPPFKQPSSLQNQHGINKFNMNWKLMKCEPPPLPPDCQPLGNTELLEIRRREGENEIIVTITPLKAAVSKAIKLARCQEADLCDWLQHAQHSSVTQHFVILLHSDTEGRAASREEAFTLCVVIIPVYKSHSYKQATKTFRRTHANDCTQIRLQCNPELLVSDYGRLCVK